MLNKIDFERMLLPDTWHYTLKENGEGYAIEFPIRAKSVLKRLNKEFILNDSGSLVRAPTYFIEIVTFYMTKNPCTEESLAEQKNQCFFVNNVLYLLLKILFIFKTYHDLHRHGRFLLSSNIFLSSMHHCFHYKYLVCAHSLLDSPGTSVLKGCPCKHLAYCIFDDRLIEPHHLTFRHLDL